MEITRHNLNDNIKGIEENLQSCVFMSMDMEFSGLASDESYKYSLFDTSSNRYNVIKNRTVGIVATQIGLSTFHFNRDCNTYKASTYTFHLCPQSIGDVAQQCTFQSSAFKFLCDNKFDFNKVFYDGLPYLNKNEEEIFLRNLNDGSIAASKSFEENDEIQDAYIKITKWMESKNKKDDTMTFSGSNLFCYLLAKEIRLKFPNLDVTFNNTKVEVKKHSEKQDTSAKRDAEDKLNFFVSTAGFTRIVKTLEKVKKPLVLHNGFMDLILFYRLFIRPLPNKYDDFKNDLHKIFPSVFDTKYISGELKFIVKREEYSESSKLETLYTFFKDAKGRYLALHSPCILMKDDFDPTPHFHQAGWDSFCTGYCFIRLGHWAACSRLFGTDQQLGSTQHLHAVSQYCNIIYLSRAAMPHTCLDQPDPKSHRPQHLYLKFVGDKISSLSKITKELSMFGSIDVRKYGRKGVLVAVTNNISARKILNEYKTSKEYKISQYDFIKHSSAARMALWSGFLLCSGSLVVLIVHQMKTL